jgi:hypothetical protein
MHNLDVASLRSHFDQCDSASCVAKAACTPRGLAICVEIHPAIGHQRPCCLWSSIHDGELEQLLQNIQVGFPCVTKKKLHQPAIVRYAIIVISTGAQAHIKSLVGKARATQINNAMPAPCEATAAALASYPQIAVCISCRLLN